ncbi:GTP-binding protein [Billgrantia pellis]|uniref:GTP-binding protein n=1 Tax=Billgrantia pellis TaxID=2606936 RepID=A0A7V7KJ08_9GAMM|nr:GTP-binding protein [Halomonas pellis]KAA0013582.1 GTP-binding protein [Halomonas pellis]
MKNASAAPIPVHVVTGFLGSGKSTLIRSLIEQKPEQERWAILINEFGRIGIDQTMFGTRNDVMVKGLPGGCLCCQLAFVMQATLVNLLHRHRPERLIIEPSGLGHPAGLLDVLRGEAFSDVLEIRDILVLLDPARLDDPRSREHDTFRDQLTMADAVVLTMTDRVSTAQLDVAWRHVESLWPAKKWIAEAPHGALSIERLLGSGTYRGEAGEPASVDHDRLRHTGGVSVVLDDVGLAQPLPGRPLQESDEALGYATLGWRWHPADVFCLDRLTRALDRLPVGLRVKGVLHTDDGWKLFNRTEGSASLTDSAWRQDSRLELIGEREWLPAAEGILNSLQDCRLEKGAGTTG